MPDRNDVADDRNTAIGANGAAPASATAEAKRKNRRRLLIGVAVVFIGAWAVALTYSVTAGGRSPERLGDADAKVAEQACLEAQQAMTALPGVTTHSSPTARADRVASEDASLQKMIDTIRAVRPTADAPRTALTAWLDDWQQLVDARQHYSHDVRTLGARARFVEPAAVGIQPIADKMNDWILEQGTRTDDCNTGRLQAEVVEGPRVYGKESNS